MCIVYSNVLTVVGDCSDDRAEAANSVGLLETGESGVAGPGYIGLNYDRSARDLPSRGRREPFHEIDSQHSLTLERSWDSRHLYQDRVEQAKF